MLSVLAQLPLHIQSLRFGDLLQALRERGLDKVADKYEAAVVVECFFHGKDDPSKLTVAELFHLFSAEPDPMFSAGWDNAFRGRAYYGRGRNG